MSAPRVVISGSGLAGALEAVYLAKQGFSVTLYEYRADMRTQQMSAGASQSTDVSLALVSSHPLGTRSLHQLGLEQARHGCVERASQPSF